VAGGGCGTRSPGASRQDENGDERAGHAGNAHRLNPPAAGTPQTHAAEHSSPVGRDGETWPEGGCYFERLQKWPIPPGWSTVIASSRSR